jgi:hypothetical protein
MEPGHMIRGFSFNWLAHVVSAVRDTALERFAVQICFGGV